MYSKFPRLRMPRSAGIPAMAMWILATMANVLVGSTSLYLIEQYVCREYYSMRRPEVASEPGKINEEICKIADIQSEVAGIQGLNLFFLFTPALFLAGPWAQLAKVLGKKTVLRLNSCSTTCQVVYFFVICYFPQYFNIRLIWLGPLFDIIGGGNMILNSLLYTYIAEAWDGVELGSVLYRFTAMQLGCSFLAMTLSGLILKINVWIVLGLGIAIQALIIPSTFLLPSQPPQHYKPHRPSNPTTPSSETTSLLSFPFPSPEPKVSTLRHITRALLENYKHTYELLRTLVISSAINRLNSLSFFLLTLIAGIKVIFTQWASVHYGWSIANVNLLTSFEMILSGLVLLLLPLLGRKVILPVWSKSTDSTHQKALTMAFFSLVFTFLGLLLMALAPSRGFYVAAIALYTLGAGLNDSIRNFSTGICRDKEEVENMYVGMGIMVTLGGMGSSAGWNWLFARAVDGGWFAQRGPFWGALACLLAVAVVIWRLGKYVKGIGGRYDAV